MGIWLWNNKAPKGYNEPHWLKHSLKHSLKQSQRFEWVSALTGALLSGQWTQAQYNYTVIERLVLCLYGGSV